MAEFDENMADDIVSGPSLSDDDLLDMEEQTGVLVQGKELIDNLNAQREALQASIDAFSDIDFTPYKNAINNERMDLEELMVLSDMKENYANLTQISRSNQEALEELDEADVEYNEQVRGFFEEKKKREESTNSVFNLEDANKGFLEFASTFEEISNKLFEDQFGESIDEVLGTDLPVEEVEAEDVASSEVDDAVLDMEEPAEEAIVPAEEAVFNEETPVENTVVESEEIVNVEEPVENTEVVASNAVLDMEEPVETPEPVENKTVIEKTVVSEEAVEPIINIENPIAEEPSIDDAVLDMDEPAEIETAELEPTVIEAPAIENTEDLVTVENAVEETEPIMDMEFAEVSMDMVNATMAGLPDMISNAITGSMGALGDNLTATTKEIVNNTETNKVELVNNEQTPTESPQTNTGDVIALLATRLDELAREMSAVRMALEGPLTVKNEFD
jgi:hypothetical protein